MTESCRYAVVGCSSCHELWLIDEDDEADSLECPRCRTDRPASERKRLASADDREVAAELRARIIAQRAGEADDYADVDDYGVLADRLDSAAINSDAFGDAADEVLGLVDESADADAGDDVDPTTDPGTGPDVDVDVADRPQLDAKPAEADVEPGLRWVNPGGQVKISGIVTRRVPPQRSRWLQNLLDDLLSSTARLVQDIARDRAPQVLATGRVDWLVAEVLATEVAGLEDAPISVTAQEEARTFLEALARYAILWDREEYRKARGFKGAQQFRVIQETLRTTGTSQGQFNAGVDALRHSLVQLHAERAAPLSLTFSLDGETWTNADAETVRGTLELFDALAESFDVRLVASPGVRQRIRRLVRNAADGRDDDNDDDDEPESAGPAWVERYERLNDTGTASRRSAPAADDETSRNHDREGWAFVDEHSTETGLLTVLAHLDSDGDRSVKSLKRDAAIEYADASIDVFCRDLEAAGLVDVDRSYPSNRLSLKSLGEAAQQFIATDGTVVHPRQSQFGGEPYAHPPAVRKYSVAPHATGGVGYAPAEWWLAETGQCGQDASFVEWLGDRRGAREVDKLVLHRRFEAGNRVNGVNFVDDHLLKWGVDETSMGPAGDGRKTYVSCFDDHMLVICQWGRPAPTLARLVSGLLDSKSLSKVLDIDTVGTQFEQLFDGVGTFKNDLEDVLLRAQQIGWLSEDELAHYDSWRERIADVKGLLLSKMSDLGDMDAGLRRDLMKDLQGLLTSATHLYHAAGIEITTVVRMPDPVELQRDEQRYQDFLDFMRFTATKQAGYEDEHGFHSIFRMLMEDRPEKLKTRSSYDVDEAAPTADLTMNWQVVGPGVSGLLEDVEAAIAKETARLREPIEEGVEDAALLEIPIVEANSHARTRHLVREIGDRKGFDEQHRDDVDRLARVLEAALATDEWAPSPYLVADVLDSLESRDRPWDSLDVHALESGLATLPADCIFPELKPAQRQMLSALLEADEPLSRQNLIETTSESSYYRHHKELAAFWLVEQTDDGDYVAAIEPWWASTNDAAEPFQEEHPSRISQPPGGQIGFSGPRGYPDEILYLADDHVEWDVIPPDRYVDIGDRQIDRDWRETFRELDLKHWSTIFWAYCDWWRESVSPSYSDPSPVRIGPKTVAHDEDQPSLETAVST